jgi:hypothetical protein
MVRISGKESAVVVLPIVLWGARAGIEHCGGQQQSQQQRPQQAHQCGRQQGHGSCSGAGTRGRRGGGRCWRRGMGRACHGNTLQLTVVCWAGVHCGCRISVAQENAEIDVTAGGIQHFLVSHTQLNHSAQSARGGARLCFLPSQRHVCQIIHPHLHG